MALMTKKRNRKMPDFKPREEWDKEHEANVAKLLGKKKAPDSGATGTSVSMEAMQAYLRRAPSIPATVSRAAGVVDLGIRGSPAPSLRIDYGPPVVMDTEVRIRRIVVILERDYGPWRVGDRVACMACPGAGHFRFQCGSCHALIRWDPFGERDGRCPGCGSMIEALLYIRVDGRLRTAVVYGPGDIPWL